MNDLKTDSRPYFDSSGSKLKFALYLVPVVLVVVFTAWALWPRSGTASNVQLAEATDPAQMKSQLAAQHDILRDIQDLKVKLEGMQAVSDNFANQEALIGARSVEADTLRDSTHGLIEQLSEERTAWVQRIEPLLDNDAGRRLAGDNTIVTRICTNWLPDNYMTDPAVEPQGFANRLEKLAQANQPSPEVIERYKTLRDDLQQTLVFIQQRRKGIEALVANTTAATPAGRTLRVAVDDIRKQKDADHAARIAAMVEQAEAERVALMGEREAELYRKNTERLDAEKRLEISRVEKQTELVRIQEKAELELAEKKAELARTQAAEEQRDIEQKTQLAKLSSEFERDMSEVKKVLGPFITPGYTQFEGGSWTTHTEKAPVSLMALVTAGALDDSMNGMTQLANIGCMPREQHPMLGHNDRPRWAVMRRGSQSLYQSKIEFVKRAQELLRKYGDLMVERGMLAP